MAVCQMIKIPNKFDAIHVRSDTEEKHTTIFETMVSPSAVIVSRFNTEQLGTLLDLN